MYLLTMLIHVPRRKTITRSKLTFVAKITRPSGITASVTLTSHMITDYVISAMSYTSLVTVDTIPSLYTFCKCKATHPRLSFELIFLLIPDKLFCLLVAACPNLSLNYNGIVRNYNRYIIFWNNWYHH